MKSLFPLTVAGVEVEPKSPRTSGMLVLVWFLKTDTKKNEWFELTNHLKFLHKLLKKVRIYSAILDFSRAKKASHLCNNLHHPKTECPLGGSMTKNEKCRPALPCLGEALRRVTLLNKKFTSKMKDAEQKKKLVCAVFTSIYYPIYQTTPQT